MMPQHSVLAEINHNRQSLAPNDSSLFETARPTGSCYQPTRKRIDSDCSYSNEDDVPNAPLTSPLREVQHVKTVHIPKALADGPFLQHPRLTPGQKRYLCSIATTHSTEHVRRVMQQHYLNVLHRCTQPEPCPFKEFRNEDQKVVRRDGHEMCPDRTTDSRTFSARRKSSVGSGVIALHSGRIVLPSISERPTRKVLRPQAPKRKSRKSKRNVSKGQSTSVKARKYGADSNSHEETRMEFLHESMDSLSIQEKVFFFKT